METNRKSLMPLAERGEFTPSDSKSKTVSMDNAPEWPYQADEFLPHERFINFPEVQRYIPLSKSRYYFLMKAGVTPKCVKISEHKACWLLSEVLSYANQQIRKRNMKGGGS